MNEPVINEQQIDDLFTKLDALELDPQQRDLLTAIIAVARDLTEVEIAESSLSFSEDFAGSFTPHKAGLVIEYAHTPTTPSMISRNPGANPAMISRSMISRNPHP
jgi:hypothetical protein